MSRFLSTLSLRRATQIDKIFNLATRNFYPRSPCGERPLFLRCGPMTRRYFYPRSPCGERRWIKSSIAAVFAISIHALLAESDKARGERINRNIAFLSTLSLRRATSQCRTLARGTYGFLSTLSLRRATFADVVPVQYGCISIHALLAESDQEHQQQSKR